MPIFFLHARGEVQIVLFETEDGKLLRTLLFARNCVVFLLFVENSLQPTIKNLTLGLVNSDARLSDDVLLYSKKRFLKTNQKFNLLIFEIRNYE